MCEVKILFLKITFKQERDNKWRMHSILFMNLYPVHPWMLSGLASKPLCSSPWRVCCWELYWQRPCVLPPDPDAAFCKQRNKYIR